MNTVDIAAKIKQHAAGAAGDNRAEIRIREELNAVTDEAIKAIEGHEEALVYTRGRLLVTIARNGSPRTRWLKRPPGAPVIVPIEKPRMLGILDECARWTRFVKRDNEWRRSRPPEWVAVQLLGRLEWPFPYIEAVTETPTLRPDGTVIDTPGWDEATGLLYEPQPGAAWPDVPAEPSDLAIEAAVDVLLDPVKDFPFVAESDKAAYVAAVLSIVARHLIDGPVPMFPIRAPTPGTGKTLLADVIGLIGTGRVPAAMAMTFQTEELRKRVHALAMDGTPLVLLENVSGSLGSDVLAGALTATEWKDRILGKSEMIAAPLRAVWLATGNNLGFQRTLGRRVIPIDLDAAIESPEDRTDFAYADLRAYVRRRRPDLVTAALTILRGFHLAGRPRHGKPRMGSFEAWDDLVRSAVIWAGMDDLATTKEGEGRGRIRAQADDDVEALREVLAALRRCFGTEPFATAQVMARAQVDDDFRAVLDVFASPPRGGHATPNSVGGKFRDQRDRPVGGFVLRRIRRSWTVEETSG